MMSALSCHVFTHDVRRKVQNEGSAFPDGCRSWLLSRILASDLSSPTAVMGQSPSTPTATPPLQTTPASHPQSFGNVKPPPECPMHASSSSTPYSPPPASLSPSASSQKPAECPVQSDPSTSTLNPLNQMPHLPQSRAPNQVLDLPLNRESSTIPRPATSSLSGAPHEEKVWEYPSPQQFYNALVRKGWETPEEHVETMVEIHNFLNEMAWQEVLKWEKRLPK